MLTSMLGGLPDGTFAADLEVGEAIVVLESSDVPPVTLPGALARVSIDAVRRAANGTRYSLAAGLQTRDLTRAHRAAAALWAGIVWVNGWSLLDPSMPFGGIGQSGYGRENGPEGLNEYLRTKSVVVNLG